MDREIPKWINSTVQEKSWYESISKPFPADWYLETDSHCTICSLHYPGFEPATPSQRPNGSTKAAITKPVDLEGCLMSEKRVQGSNSLLQQEDLDLSLRPSYGFSQELLIDSGREKFIVDVDVMLYGSAALALLENSSVSRLEIALGLLQDAADSNLDALWHSINNQTPHLSWRLVRIISEYGFRKMILRRNTTYKTANRQLGEAHVFVLRGREH
ncbi:hypothetical protein TWF102_000205 [Orbilia oligospora]|uniref:Uncharacterized protein n=1 Tax=Orbilia oligospora TaxID=2813651 RepID=A0A7C8NMG8_ORBOL|nr:hypothetical protein TWF102_000205 [Orbilia oligospora]KAF3115305.1 hypothetical protein TWF103_011563 [Orbilia oligospora]KAF3116802.1 hypothetical protein TWF706_000027 [Orbilia oligospora]